MSIRTALLAVGSALLGTVVGLVVIPRDIDHRQGDEPGVVAESEDVSPSTFSITGDVFVPSDARSKKLGAACVPAPEYAHLKVGTPVVVRNSNGDITGTGTLNSSTNGVELLYTHANEGCVLDFKVEGVPYRDGPWTVKAGVLPEKPYEPAMIRGRDLGYPVQWNLVE